MPRSTAIADRLDTYLALVRNSVGSRLFRNAFFVIGGRKRDVLRDGNLSCAMYVSSILLLLKLISATHTTVKGTMEDMVKSGWMPISRPRVGCVLIWETKTFRASGESHRHIGFYVGGNKAVSNSSKKGYPVTHHWTFGRSGTRPRRRIEVMYWNSRLDKSAGKH